MKHLFTTFLFIFLLFSNSFKSQNQVLHNHTIKIDETKALSTFRYKDFMRVFGAKCKVKGYNLKNDACLRNFFSVPQSQLLHEIFDSYADNAMQITIKNLYKKNLDKFSELLNVFIEQETYVRNEYAKRHVVTKTNPSPFKGSNPNVQAACVNQDFEANNLSGWNVSSGAGGTYVTNTGTDPQLPLISTVYNGLHSVCLNALTGSGGVRDGESINQTFLVTPQNANYIFYVAVIGDAGGHPCGSNAYFTVNVKNSSGSVVPCSNIDLIASDDSGNPCSTYTGWQTSGTYDYLDWSPVIVPLQAYIGQNVTISMEVYRCDAGGHGMRAYIEASCNPFDLTLYGGVICNGSSVTLAAPKTTGYSYNWAGPGGLTTNSYSLSSNLVGLYTVTLAVTSNPSCSMVMDTILTAAASPTASFVYSVTPCSSGNVSVLSTSIPPAGQTLSSYTWVWGDASPNGSVTPMVHTYSASATQTIELKIETTAGCSDSVQHVVTVSLPPTVSFSLANSCIGIVSSFTSITTPTIGIVTQTWFWGDGSSSGVGNNPTHNYANSGVYTVTCNITSVAGCSATTSQSVSVFPKPTIVFSSNPVCLNSITNFTTTSSVLAPSTISAWAWDFNNDGITDNATQNPSYSFTPTGTYNVELKVTTNNGCSDSLVQSITVNPIPTVLFTASDACEHGNVLLTNSSSVVAPDNLTLYNWNFGIGGSSTTSSNQLPTNLSYANYGIKTITLTVTSNHSCTATSTNTVLINATPVVNFSFVNKCVNAQPNTFDASSSNIALGTNSVYAWSFGDGTTGANTITTTHTYVAAGLYNTTLTITSDKGCVASITKQVEVYEKPIVSINHSNACFRAVMSFTSTSAVNSGNVVNWAWDFNNNISTIEGSGQTTNYNFLSEGSQTVNLLTTTDHGCVETNSVMVYINYLPSPAFVVDKPSGCPIHCVVFKDQTPAITTPETNALWTWTFGDGTKVTANNNANQSHCYNNTSTNQLATYDVKLVVTTSAGCKDSLTKNAFITVFPAPIATYTIIPDLGDVTAPQVHFDNYSIDYTKWWWNFGDGSMVDSTHQNPLHNYPSTNADSYYSSLIVENQYGCRDTAIVKVDIKPEFVFYIPNAFTPENLDGINDMFTGTGVGIVTYEMWVFDRWGARVYYTDDIYKGWNGKIQQSGNIGKQDVYVWKVKLKDIFGKNHEYVGHVTLLR